jgi:hypothetical protein
MPTPNLFFSFSLRWYKNNTFMWALRNIHEVNAELWGQVQPTVSVQIFKILSLHCDDSHCNILGYDTAVYSGRWVPICRGNMLHTPSGLKLETVYFSEDEMDGACSTLGKVRNVHKIMSENRDRKRPLGWSISKWHKWKDYIKKYNKK